MGNEERIADELAKSFQAVGLEAKAKGGGVHWTVIVGDDACSLEVNCFWYGPAAGLMLGMNAANQRSGLQGRPQKVYQGPEYDTKLRQNGRQVAEGRTYLREEVVAAAQAWLESADVEVVRTRTPFVDKRRQAMLALAAGLADREWELTGDPGYELWVHGGGRSCRVVQRGEAFLCHLMIGQVEVAQLDGLDDLSDVVRVWLDNSVTVTQLPDAIVGTTIARHAEHLEAEPAVWHWLHLRDRINDPHDALAALASFIELLAKSPIATRFFSFSSLDRFCFSSSSHYPWVTDGLPIIAPNEDTSHVWVDQELLSYQDAVNTVEHMLKAATYPPFFGTSVDVELPLLRQAFAKQGSELQVNLIHQQQWRSVVVNAAPRSCQFTGLDSVEMITPTAKLWTDWPSVDEAVEAVIRFLEANAPLGEFEEASRGGNQAL